MNDLGPSSSVGASAQTSKSGFSLRSSKGINLEIEYLRAAAILLVILAHSNVLFHLRLGMWTGVDLFFCISGYVISRSFEPLLDRYRREGRWWDAARAFWIRRIFRLVPSAWLWLFIAVACSWAFNESDAFYSFAGNLRSVPFIVLNVANFAMASGDLGGNGVYWTLALEDQFYLAFPFLLFLVRSEWRWRLLVLLILLQALPDRSMTAHPYLWFTRLDALMWGCLIHQFSRWPMYSRLEPVLCRNRIVALSINAVLLSLLAAIPVLLHWRETPNHKVESLVALTAAALVFLASYERSYVLPLPTPLQAILAWIGSRSYGIYLIHIPLFAMVKETWFRYAELSGETPSDARFALHYAVMVLILLPLLAELNFRFVESPLRRKGKAIAQRIMARRPAAANAARARPETIDAPATAP